MRTRKPYWVIQYRYGDSRWETIETTSRESEAEYLFAEYKLAYGRQGELRMVKKGGE